MGYAIDLWKIVLNSNCSKETRINIKNGLDELNAKAKAFDEISDVIKKAEFYDRDTALDIIEIVECLEDK